MHNLKARSSCFSFVMVENEYFWLLARAYKIIFEICCGEPMAGSSRRRIGAQSRDSMLQRAGGVPMGMGAAGDDSQQTAGMKNPYCFHHSQISAWKIVKGRQEEGAKRNRAVDEDEKWYYSETPLGIQCCWR
jgi:hypothetical protein